MSVAQQQPCILHGLYKSLSGFTTLFRSHGAFSRLQYGSYGVRAFWRSTRNTGLEIFTCLVDVSDKQGVSVALNSNGPVEPAKMQGQTPTPYQLEGV